MDKIEKAIERWINSGELKDRKANEQRCNSLYVEVCGLDVERSIDFWDRNAMAILYGISERLRMANIEEYGLETVMCISQLEEKHLFLWLRENHEVEKILECYYTALDNRAEQQRKGLHNHFIKFVKKVSKYVPNISLKEAETVVKKEMLDKSFTTIKSNQELNSDTISLGMLDFWRMDDPTEVDEEKDDAWTVFMFAYLLYKKNQGLESFEIRTIEFMEIFENWQFLLNLAYVNKIANQNIKPFPLLDFDNIKSMQFEMEL